MKVIRPSSITEALEAWGRHELYGPRRQKLEREGWDVHALCPLDVVEQFRAPWVERIEASRPIEAFAIEIETVDEARIRLADGRKLAQWIADATDVEGERYVEELARSPAPIEGPLLSVMQSLDGSVENSIDPIVLFDGWHRAVAWHRQLSRGADYPIPAFLITVELPVPLAPEPKLL